MRELEQELRDQKIQMQEQLEQKVWQPEADI
jgi:hypothetical protein